MTQRREKIPLKTDLSQETPCIFQRGNAKPHFFPNISVVYILNKYFCFGLELKKGKEKTTTFQFSDQVFQNNNEGKVQIDMILVTITV